MKNFFKKLGRWLLGIVLFLVALMIVFIAMSASSKKKMTPADTGLLTEDVYAVRDKYVNMYLVRDGNDYIAIDAGIKPGNIRGELKKLDIDPDRVRAGFLTHSDADHAGGISMFKRATIYMHRNEEKMINGETGRMLWIGNNIDAKEYTLLDDHTVRIGGLRIKPIPTPGHTAGLTCYLVNDIYLFTGDAVSLRDGVIGLFPKYINKYPRKARRSVQNILNLEGVMYIFTGHHGFSANYSSAVRGYRE
ncbi:MAG TPA: MBL fold metallo-hydrolase [Bacteroidales bacterium]|nr:MBL fold metallo-hydrolase [Bacteroidales bacterium]